MFTWGVNKVRSAEAAQEASLLVSFCFQEKKVMQYVMDVINQFLACDTSAWYVQIMICVTNAKRRLCTLSMTW